MNRNIALFIATFGGIGGYIGGGTIVSCLMIPCMYFPFMLNVLLLGLLLVLAYCTMGTVCAYYRNDDPRQIVIDEAIGAIFLIGCLQYSGYETIYDSILSIMLFRLFDISKIGGIKYVEMLPGAVGVISDDIVAAVYAYCMYVFFI